MRVRALTCVVLLSVPQGLAGQRVSSVNATVVHVESGASERERVHVRAGGATTPDAVTRWMQAGDSLFADARYRESIAAYELAFIATREGSAEGAWKVARSYARIGNRRQALRWLGHARERGFDDDASLAAEPAFGRFLAAPQPSVVRPRIAGIRYVRPPTTEYECRRFPSSPSRSSCARQRPHSLLRENSIAMATRLR